MKISLRRNYLKYSITGRIVGSCSWPASNFKRIQNTHVDLSILLTTYESVPMSVKAGRRSTARSLNNNN